MDQGTESRFLQDPDDDINAGFSCLINEKETGLIKFKQF